jgi:hypothetical protein
MDVMEGTTMNKPVEHAAAKRPDNRNKPQDDWTRAELAQSICDKMYALYGEWIEHEGRHPQPSASLLANWQVGQAQSLHVRDALTEDNKALQNWVFKTYSPILQDDEWSEQKISDSERYRLREEAEYTHSSMYRVLCDQLHNEERKADPDQAKIDRLTIDRAQCIQDRHDLLGASVSEQKALIAKYTPLIQAYYQQQREQNAESQGDSGNK